MKATLDELAARGGGTGPMLLTMANSSALLRGYADLNYAMKRSQLDRTISERISLRRHDYRGEQIADVVGLIALNLMTGGFNPVAGIEPAESLRSAA